MALRFCNDCGMFGRSCICHDHSDKVREVRLALDKLGGRKMAITLLEILTLDEAELPTHP